MYRMHFGLRCAPLGKDTPQLWEDGALSSLRERFLWLLRAPGVGVITGEAGVGKTATVRHLVNELINPHRHLPIYLSETDFGRLDLYRSLALALGLDPLYRRAAIWRELKAHITDLADNKQVTVVWLIDEAQNLHPSFFRDFPSFLNFAFDSRDLLTVWFIGHPQLGQTLDRAPYAALASRIHVRVHLKPVLERERFTKLVQHAFQAAGCTTTLISDSGMELLRQASQGLPRQAGRILQVALQLAASKKLNHLPDDVLQQAVNELR